MDKIEIRATKFETYWTCPYRYKNAEESDSEAEHFTFGSDLHKYIELRLHKEINDITETMILSKRGVKQRLMIIKMANLVEELVEKKKYTLVCSERTNKFFFEDINILLEGTFDHLFKNTDGDLILMDVKTTKSKRTQDHKDEVRQNIIYPSLLKLKYNLDIKYFEYRTLTKTSNPVLEDICFEVTGDPTAEVREKLQELRDSTDKDFFPPKYTNHMCRYCGLRDKCKEYIPN